ncbi:MAG: hypothetical protein H0U95_17035 [Bacteroidetes bacterium]|nr:hypothetical protein [Bacteroidota bacterium]
MSSAFVKEGDDMWLHDIVPTFDALVNYLTRENGGLRITEKENYFSEELQKQIHKMSEGFSYAIQDNKWVLID